MKPFLLGKKSVEAPQLRASHTIAPMAANGGAHATHGGPNVETVKQGDKIVRLIVTCSCGERIEVECLYPAGN